MAAKNGKKLKVGFSIEHVQTARLLVLPMARPAPKGFRAEICAVLKSIWTENFVFHEPDWEALRRMDDEGCVLWGYSEFRVREQSGRFSWREWDAFFTKHYGKCPQNPERSPEVTIRSVTAEARFLIARGVIQLEGILLKPAEPPTKKRPAKKRRRSSAEDAVSDDDDSDSDARWDYAASLGADN